MGMRGITPIRIAIGNDFVEAYEQVLNKAEVVRGCVLVEAGELRGSV